MLVKEKISFIIKPKNVFVPQPHLSFYPIKKQNIIVLKKGSV